MAAEEAGAEAAEVEATEAAMAAATINLLQVINLLSRINVSLNIIQ